MPTTEKTLVPSPSGIVDSHDGDAASFPIIQGGEGRDAGDLSAAVDVILFVIVVAVVIAVVGGVVGGLIVRML